MNAGTMPVLAELRSRLQSLYGTRLSRIVLFGSQARRDASKDSDIDILVVLQGAVRPGKEIARVGGITAALSLQYDVVVSCTFVSEERYAAEQSPLLLNARKEGMVV